MDFYNFFTNNKIDQLKGIYYNLSGHHARDDISIGKIIKHIAYIRVVDDK